MWDALYTFYGGEKNVLRAKAESFRGKFNDMRMHEVRILLNVALG